MGGSPADRRPFDGQGPPPPGPRLAPLGRRSCPDDRACHAMSVSGVIRSGDRVPVRPGDAVALRDQLWRDVSLKDEHVSFRCVVAVALS